MSGVPRLWVAGPADAAAVAGLLADFRDFMGRDGPSDESFAASVERLIGSDDCEYLLASPTPEGEAQALCQLRYRYGVWYGAEDCWLEDLYVDAGARRTGLGAALMSAALSRARDRGCARVELDTHEANAAALALYERFGFTPREATGERKVFMRLVFETAS